MLSSKVKNDGIEVVAVVTDQQFYHTAFSS